MNILASVYACSPYDGSERAVGWNWIVQLNKYHSITALTSHVYKKDIEDYLQNNPNELTNTKFIYIDVPHTNWHVGYNLERLYYILWQRQAVKIAKQLVKKEKFDLIHHITYVTCILPTYMYELGIPFLYGPVSGGENTPSVIGYPMNCKQRIIELVRAASQFFFRSTPNFTKTMNGSNLILVTTDETKGLIPAKYHNKIQLFQSIGLDDDIFYPEPQIKDNKTVQFLVAGRMLYWKGFELAIRSFVKAIDEGCIAELTILGDTENNPSYEQHKKYLQKLSGPHLDKEIHFVSNVPHNEMKEFYDRFDCLINCSLRDSGCFIVMEGMSRGLPLICVNTGGPKINTTNECAIKIDPAPMGEMINDISKSIIVMTQNKEMRERMGKEARRYAFGTFRISYRTRKMNEFYKLVVENTEQ